MAEDSSEIVREVAESVSATNLKSLGDAPAFYNNMMMANSTNQQQLNAALAASLMAKAGEAVISLSPGEAAGDTALVGMLAKMMGNVPPVTP